MLSIFFNLFALFLLISGAVGLFKAETDIQILLANQDIILGWVIFIIAELEREKR